MTIAAVHGWAGGPFIWTELQKKLSGNWSVYDRGYRSENPGWTAAPVPADLMIYHSMGPLFVSPEHLSPEVPIVYLNGFDAFLGNDTGYRRLAERNLEHLKRAVEADAASAVASFYRSGNTTPPAFSGSWNTERLLSDLALLQHTDDLLSRFSDHPLLVILSEKDAVAGDSTRKRLLERANRVIFADKFSHVLPLTHAEIAAESIVTWLKERPF